MVCLFISCRVPFDEQNILIFNTDKFNNTLYGYYFWNPIFFFVRFYLLLGGGEGESERERERWEA